MQIKGEEIQKLEDFYGNDLPNKPTFKAEVEVWKTKCSCISQKESEKIKLLDVLILADSEFFPNVHEIVKLMLTLPVGSVPCERSFSTMRLLKDWNRSTMGENRLTGLALLMVHRDMDVSRENILTRFDSTGNRRLKL